MKAFRCLKQRWTCECVCDDGSCCCWPCPGRGLRVTPGFGMIGIKSMNYRSSHAASWAADQGGGHRSVEQKWKIKSCVDFISNNFLVVLRPIFGQNTFKSIFKTSFLFNRHVGDTAAHTLHCTVYSCADMGHTSGICHPELEVRRFSWEVSPNALAIRLQVLSDCLNHLY